MEYQNLGSPLHQRKETSRTAKFLDSVFFFFVLTFHVLVGHLHCNFNINNFGNTVRHWLLRKS